MGFWDKAEVKGKNEEFWERIKKWNDRIDRNISGK